MPTAPAPSTASRLEITPRHLRIWPVPILVALMFLLPAFSGSMEDGPAWLWMASAFGPGLSAILLLLWWIAASRATGKERVAGFVGVLLIIFLTTRFMHPSMLGPATIVLVFPAATAFFAVAAACASRLLPQHRTKAALCAATAVGLGALLLRTEGLWGNFRHELKWRWTESPEEKLLSSPRKPAAGLNAAAPSDAANTSAEWSGFRGPGRDSRQTGTQFSSDWSSTPPQLLWKIPVGPGWSSFSYQAGYLFTQEQRGTQETVVCYSADTGAEVWTRGLEARFDDPLGGPGPRATPTIADGRLFALGATGVLRCLKPSDGAIIWEQNIAKVAGRAPPMWGFSSSPLVARSVVIVHAGGADEKGTLAFAVESGELRWSAPSGNDTYSSPQLSKVGSEELVLMLSNMGLDFLDPATGAVRFAYGWKHSDHRSLQPQLAGPDTVLLPTGLGAGTRLIRLRREGEALAADEVWTSRALKPDFNDLVVHRDHIYGFDGGIFTCVRLATGERVWKGGRYGKGQVLLLADSGLLLVVSERGDAVLLPATPDGHQELATHSVLAGKTWNHPAIVGDRLFVRNAEQAACYRLPTVTQRP